MKRRILSAITAIAFIISAFVIPAQAMTSTVESVDYKFSATNTIENTFKGVALANGAWEEELSTFLALDNGTLTVSSTRKAARVGFYENIAGADFDMTADMAVSIQNNRKSKTFSTGFVFGATDKGFYEMVLSADKTLAITKSDSVTSTGQGTVLKEADVSDKLDFAGTAAGVKLSVVGNIVKVYINDTEVLSYDNGEAFPQGEFGFKTTRDMTAVYSDFSVSAKKTIITYDEADYVVADFTAEVKDSSVVLNWTNPVVPYISGITIKDGNGVTIDTYTGTINNTAAKENSVTLTALKHGEEHSLRVIVSFNDGHSDTVSQSQTVFVPFTEADYNLTSFAVTSIIEGVNIAWVNPIAGTIKSITVTDKDGMAYPVNAELLAGAENNVQINGLEGGKAYTFTVTITFDDGKNVSEEGTATATVLEESKYYPKNVLVYESYTKLGLSWLNPDKAIKSITVLDYKTGNEAVFEDEISTEAGKPNNVLIKSLSSAETSNYRIIFEFEDGHENVEYVAGGMPYGKGNNYDYEQNTYTAIGDWQTFLNIQTSNYGSIPAYIYPDREEKVSGNNSVKFVSNYVKDYGNIFYRLRIEALSAYDTNYTYRINMKVKYVNAKDSILITYDNSPMNSYADGTAAPTLNVGTNLTPKVNSDGWEEVSLLLKPTKPSGAERVSGKQLAIQSRNVCEGFWIDDIEMVPVDEQGNVIGENILPNKELEASDNTPCGNVKLDTANCSLKDGMAVLKWESPDDESLKSIKIYREAYGKLYECATVSGTESEISIGNVPSDGNVKFVIKTVDTSDNLSSGVEVNVVPSLSSSLIGDIEFRYNGAVINTLPADLTGEVTINTSVKVINNSVADFTAALWVAVYNENGILTGVVTSDTVKLTTGVGEKNLKADVKAGANYTVKAFLMDDITNMKLLSEPATLK